MEEESKSENKIYTATWNHDSHGLFDYESNNISKISFKPVFGFFYRDISHKITFTPIFEKDNEKKKYLVTLDDKEGKLILYKRILKDLPINNESLESLQEQIWYVIKQKTYKTQKYTSNYIYELKKNDIIKLGRIKFIVKDMNIVGKEILKSNETFIPFEINKLSRIIEEENCRICYSNDNSNENNPMISICKCKGSMNLHLECLKLWLKSKLEIKEINNKPGVSYIINKFNCELCHEPYQITIKNNNKNYNLIDYNIPEGQNYIILQSLNSIKENNYPLSIHVLMFIENESSYILGRGHESDIRITDISVSRSHARIFMKEDKFFMEDLGSKFGSLVLAKEHVILEFGFVYQIGRSLFYFDKDNDNNNNNIDNNYFEKIKKSFLNFTEEFQ